MFSGDLWVLWSVNERICPDSFCQKGKEKNILSLFYIRIKFGYLFRKGDGELTKKLNEQFVVIRTSSCLIVSTPGHTVSPSQ